MHTTHKSPGNGCRCCRASVHVFRLGLKKGDRLVPGASLLSIHDIDELWMLPATVVFFRSSTDSQLTNLTPFITVPGINTGHTCKLERGMHELHVRLMLPVFTTGLIGFGFSLLQFDMLHTVDQGPRCSDNVPATHAHVCVCVEADMLS
jgi:hypothetical protein